MGNLLGGEKVASVPAEDRKNLFTVKMPFYTAIPAFFVDVLEKAFVWYVYRSETPNNYFMEGNFGPVDEFGPKGVLFVEGYLPVAQLYEPGFYFLFTALPGLALMNLFWFYKIVTGAMKAVFRNKWE